MTFKESVSTVLRQKYATFSGRASRSEYWFFVLFYVAVLAVIVALGSMIGGWASFSSYDGSTPNILGKLLAIIAILFVLGMIVPSIAVLVRRFHDRNMSGWWVLGLIVASVIPLVGIAAGIAQLVIVCLKGTDGPNNFGDDPLA